jgi:hypothetical protein
VDPSNSNDLLVDHSQFPNAASWALIIACLQEARELCSWQRRDRQSGRQRSDVIDIGTPSGDNFADIGEVDYSA